MLKLWLQLWTKRGHWQSCDLGESYLLMKCDVFRLNAGFFVMEWSCISLTSLSVTGLQTLINMASRYIVSHGLNFNPIKTICTTFGRCTFANSPHWQLNGSILRDEPDVNYLGTVLSNNPKATRRAFMVYRALVCVKVECFPLYQLTCIKLLYNQY